MPTIEQDECNSTRHYNGLIKDQHICAGYTDADKSPCYVSNSYKVALRLKEENNIGKKYFYKISFI